VDFAFDEEQEELRSIARSFLFEHAGSDALRQAAASDLGYDPKLWQRIGGELGWTAVIVPEACGGLGLSFVELVALLEVMGEALLCSPFFASVCLGANALLAAGTDAQQQAWLPGIAAGETRATLAFTEADGRWDAASVGARARREGDEWVLDGEKRFVPDGHCADLLLVAAREEDSEGEAGVALFAVPADAAGVERRARVTVDVTRRQADVSLRGVRLPADARLGAPDAGYAPIATTLQRAAVALAAEQIGGAQRCLDLSVAYAKERVQFGRPIGSFQAIKHRCADMLVAVESARSAGYYAACVAAEDGDELPLVASLAKAWCSDAYFRCAADAIQIHGGVGFTWEYDVHLYFKRAKSSETLLGDPAHHREQVARRIGLG
jgi:alkylation response protein AidB-like acyl-CoA dehydrogenase